MNPADIPTPIFVPAFVAVWAVGLALVGWLFRVDDE